MNNFIVSFSDELKVLEDMDEDIEKRKQRLFLRIKGMQIEELIKNKFNSIDKNEKNKEKN